MKNKSFFLLIMMVLGIMGLAYAQNMGVMFDGVNDHITLGTNQINNALTGASGISFGVWINPTTLRSGADSNRNVIIDFPNNDSFSFLNVYLRENGKVRIGGRSRKEDSFLDYVSASAIVTANKWQYLAGVLDFAGKEIHLYLDGNLVASVTRSFSSNSYVAGTGGKEIFGGNTGLTASQFFHGIMDEMKIWNYPLTHAQIQAEMYQTYTISTVPAGMIGYWNLQEGSGTIAEDLTANSFDGTLTNGAYFVNSFTPPAIVYEDGTASGAAIVPGYPIPGGLIGPDTYLPAVLYTLTSTGEKDVIVHKPNQYLGDWYCWLETPAGLLSASNPIDSSTPFVVFNDINFDAKGSIGVVINDNPTLPVELSSFTATFTSQNFVQLHWVTQSESDAQGFIIFRSLDTELEHAIQVSPMIQATNTTQTMSYIFVDEEVTIGTWFYWLQMIDMSGNFRFHGPIVVTVSEFDPDITPPDIIFRNGITKVYPNPFNPSVSIAYFLDKPSNVKINIYNTRGQMMESFDLGYQDATNHSLVWDAQNLPAGVYLISMQANNKVYTSKAVLSK